LTLRLLFLEKTGAFLPTAALRGVLVRISEEGGLAKSSTEIRVLAKRVWFASSHDFMRHGGDGGRGLLAIVDEFSFFRLLVKTHSSLPAQTILFSFVSRQGGRRLLQELNFPFLLRFSCGFFDGILISWMLKTPCLTALFRGCYPTSQFTAGLPDQCVLQVFLFSPGGYCFGFDFAGFFFSTLLLPLVFLFWMVCPLQLRFEK